MPAATTTMKANAVATIRRRTVRKAYGTNARGVAWDMVEDPLMLRRHRR
jgi:hypothetical protein